MKSPQQQTPPWPLDAIFRGVDISCFRSAWDDPNALYLAVKGGDNKAPHAHLDLGSFVLDAGGVRWAADLGTDDYDLPGYFGRQRWSYYRTRTESHNTLLIDDQNQDQRAEARITRQEFAPDFSWVQIDLSRANPGKVKQWTRRFGLAQRQAFLIGDTVRSDQPVEVIWGMMTDAEIVVSGSDRDAAKERMEPGRGNPLAAACGVRYCAAAFLRATGAESEFSQADRAAGRQGNRTRSQYHLDALPRRSDETENHRAVSRIAQSHRILWKFTFTSANRCHWGIFSKRI